MGHVYVYTGDGKGKTTAALGLAVRSLGHGHRVLLVQFMKDSMSGEIRFVHENYEAVQFGTEMRSIRETTQEDRELARRALQFAVERTLVFSPDLLILDEAVWSVGAGLLSEGELIGALEQMRSRCPGTTIVLTGRYITRGLLEYADFVNEVVEVKASNPDVCMKGIQW